MVAQRVMNLPAMQENPVQFLGWEDPLGKVRLSTPASKEYAHNVGDLGSIPGLGRDPMEKGKATHSSILAWRIPWTV